jgi:3-hydroxybutyryl-CoA dehydratase
MSFTAQHLYFDDVEIGQEWESPARTLTETDIVNFAGLSGDFNAIHMDHEFARSTAFGRPIAHGLLGMAISSGLAVNTPAMRTMAFREIKEWHFKEPIFIGDTIRVKTKVLAKEPRSRGRRGYITWQRQIINQAGKVVQEGVSVTLVEGRGMMKDDNASRNP